MKTLLIVLACMFALIGGYNVWQSFAAMRRVAMHKKVVSSVAAADSQGTAEGLDNTIGDKVIDLMYRCTRDFSLKRGMRIAPPNIIGKKWFESNAQLAGIEGEISYEGFNEVRVRLAIAGTVLGALAGAVLSIPLAIVLAFVGAYFGWTASRRSIEGRIKWRAQETERHLPEMLDVVALGMRSGLSFDTSLGLYSEHFDTVLSRELASAQRQWTSGLVRRDEALRKVAASYDSAVFSRVVETIIRSIRYGSSMVQSLEGDAVEARNAYQAVREERIAKAPVKMMLPTGVLILPAMLLMILGPVLLELAGGGL